MAFLVVFLVAFFLFVCFDFIFCVRVCIVLVRSLIWCELHTLPALQIRKNDCSCPLTVGPEASDTDFDFKSQTVSLWEPR